MSIGHYKAFTDLNAGQWFAAPGGKGVKIGLVVQFSKEHRPPNELRPVFVSESEAISTSPSITRESGRILVTKDGVFLHFTHNSHGLFANIATGKVTDSHTQALWFRKWTLWEKKPDGYKSILDFGA